MSHNIRHCRRRRELFLHAAPTAHCRGMFPAGYGRAAGPSSYFASSTQAGPLASRKLAT